MRRVANHFIDEKNDKILTTSPLRDVKFLKFDMTEMLCHVKLDGADCLFQYS